MRFLTFLFFALCLFSCGKKRTIHITATNGATGVRYAGLQYFVVSSTTTGGGEKYKTEKSGFLNANGDMVINNGIQNIFHLYSNGVLSLHGDNGIESFRVEGSGLVRCRKIKVDTQTWPDYVFEKDYHLMPLKELEEYIQTNKHLPNIPCQEQVLKDGVELGEMNVKLLEKIEELTRYLIEQNKELKVLKEEVNQLKNGKL